MAGFDLEEFLNHKYYALNFQHMLGDVLDFLEFSERNMEWQYRSEIQRIEREAQFGFLTDEHSEYEAILKRDLIQRAEHRFTVSLPMRLRYGTLIALITTIEWQTRFFKECVNFEFGKKPDGMNETIHILRGLCSKLNIEASKQIVDLENLIHVRNAIVHAAGLSRDYQFGPKLAKAVEDLDGIVLGHWHFFGETVRIERGALDPYIEEYTKLIPMIFETADAKGLLKETP